MTPLIFSIIALVLSCLFGMVGYLIKRSVFGEIDMLRKEVEAKLDEKVFKQFNKSLEDTLEEIKKSMTKNGETLEKVAIDMAVLKDRAERI